jgi:hypothetical protein
VSNQTTNRRPPTRTPLRQTPGGAGRLRRGPVHPDDVLKDLARSPKPLVTPNIEFLTRSKPPANPYVIALWGVLGLVALVAAVPLVIGSRTGFEIQGLAANAALNPAELTTKVIDITVDPPNDAGSVRVELDGRPIEPTRTDGKLSVVLGAALSEGEHTLSMSAGSRVLYKGPSRQAIKFRVDGTPPEPTISIPSGLTTLEDDVVVTGLTEPGATVTVNGREAVVAEDGSYRVEFARVPIGAFRVVAVDAAGNRGTSTAPGLGAKLIPATRGVHVSAAAWDYQPLKDGILQLIRDGKINTVQLDLKDEDGRIGHRSQVPMVNQIGASDNLYDLAAEVAVLKGLGVRVVGRLVVFRDPTLAKAAWEGGQREQVLQNELGQPYNGKYGGKFGSFTNPFNETVRKYNSAVALEAAQAGVDDILLDYIRRPEAKIDKLSFAGATTPEKPVDKATVSAEIVEYVDELARILGETPARLGASVFGIAVIPEEGANIAQDIPEMSKHLDYISPMIYPSSWGKGQLGVADPPTQPYDIIFASLKQFQQVSKGSGTKIIPWLQDFNLIVKYGTEDVRAQIVASADVCITDWLMWDPKVTYNAAALPVGVQKPSVADVKCPS